MSMISSSNSVSSRNTCKGAVTNAKECTPLFGGPSCCQTVHRKNNVGTTLQTGRLPTALTAPLKSRTDTSVAHPEHSNVLWCNASEQTNLHAKHPGRNVPQSEGVQRHI